MVTSSVFAGTRPPPTGVFPRATPAADGARGAVRAEGARGREEDIEVKRVGVVKVDVM
jgi:hypothetical protein